MNYKLCTKDDKKVRILDLTTIFANKKDIFNLQKLDSFTSMFQDENELKVYLLSKKIISSEEYLDEILITYGVKNVRYIPVMYSNTKEFNSLKELADEIIMYFNYRKDNATSDFSYESILDNYKDITNYFSIFEVISRSKQFLNLIAGYARNNPKQKINVDDIDLFIHDDFGKRECRYLYIALFELFRREFYDYDKESKELKFSYKGFRDFCVFYCNYKAASYAKKTSEEENSKENIDEYSGEQLKLTGYR